jgi:N-acyl-D-amino-acid deacylase
VLVKPGGRPGRHPRFWGTFPRKVARYVKDRGIITLPFAIRSMTSLAAQIIGLTDRGIIRKEAKADLVVFDLAELRDRATVMQPGLASVGIHHVIINGVLAMDGKKATGALAGKVLDRNAKR